MPERHLKRLPKVAAFVGIAGLTVASATACDVTGNDTTFPTHTPEIGRAMIETRPIPGKIAFIQNIFDKDNGNFPVQLTPDSKALFIMEGETGERIKIYENLKLENVKFSPDGTKLLITLDEGWYSRFQVLNQKGDVLREFDDIASPVWTKENKLLALHVTERTGEGVLSYEKLEVQELYSIDPETGERTKELGLRVPAYTKLLLSPDNERIAYYYAFGVPRPPLEGLTSMSPVEIVNLREAKRLESEGQSANLSNGAVVEAYNGSSLSFDIEWSKDSDKLFILSDDVIGMDSNGGILGATRLYAYDFSTQQIEIVSEKSSQDFELSNEQDKVAHRTVENGRDQLEITDADMTNRRILYMTKEFPKKIDDYEWAVGDKHIFTLEGNGALIAVLADGSGFFGVQNDVVVFDYHQGD